nr:ComEC/Rec2 family competence protein [Candidatus Enterousia merdequi]
LYFFGNKEYTKRTTTNRVLHILYLSLMTAIIATVFTLPFVIAHFGYIPIYTLIGNVVILPIFSFAIMPLVMLGTIFALFGNHFLLDITNYIYQFALKIAEHISDLPYANLRINYISNSVLLLSVFGLICLISIVKPNSKNIFIRNINYIICVCFITCAVLTSCFRQKPLFYSTSDNELVAFVVDNKLKFSKAKSSAHYFVFNSWREFNGEEKQDKNERYKCVKGLCIYQTKNWKLVYIKTLTSVIKNIETICSDTTVDFIITPVKIEAPHCHAKIINRGLLIYQDKTITRISNLRPWNNQP